MSSIKKKTNTYILNIETATSVCSVALFNQTELILLKEIDDGYKHAENLHVFISDLISQANIKIQELSAIAISKGPGSYTGLRIGTSAAKGLAYALKIPLISIDTLKIMSNAARIQNKEADFYCAMIDARRMEVYTALYDKNLVQLETTTALIVDALSVDYLKKYNRVCYFGDGAEKCQSVLSEVTTAQFLPMIKPSAKYMGDLAFDNWENKIFEDVAYFEPFYLKEFLAGKKKSVK